jgi:diguanylate cyclase (GGDEF)-like protein
MSDEHFQVLFEYAPVALWEQDFSGIKSFLGPLQAQGVTDFDSYLDQHPEAVENCISSIRSIKFNHRALDLFGAADENELLSNSGVLYRDELGKIFREGLRAIWDGKCSFKREGILYTLNGSRVEVSLEWIVVPGYEENLKKVLVTIKEINEQKKAETYIKYLGTHDVLTGLYNRAYLEEERNRLERSRQFPISIIIADLDGLKKVNESLGHNAGDDLIKRSAELLRAAFRAEDVVARTGGGEFAIIMPMTDLSAAEQSIERIRSLVKDHNQHHPGPPLNISLGAASGDKGTRLLSLQRDANNHMYLDKRSKSLHSEI